ncbi:hypothetical protein COV11_00220 [Candidatus Woesearchaeota archaeon CG10_big_fil_rev_8_21_14_0_10_30_7]|nr:MAG: hypothetical protein COV11_00220 [Candidatus Woesearchaeota archaeon CG10_big_fil_rev_8_21_14_0_10_30_7]
MLNSYFLMAIYNKKQKFGFVKNRFRDVLLIGAFFLGYQAHDYVDKTLDKFQEYVGIIKQYETKFEKVKNALLETDSIDKFVSENVVEENSIKTHSEITVEETVEVNNEPSTRYSVPRNRRRRARVIREQ